MASKIASSAAVPRSSPKAAAKLAAKAGTSNVKQNEQWRAAKDAYQKSLDIYQDMKSKSTLSGADAGKPDELAKEIAKCDAALKAGSK